MKSSTKDNIEGKMHQARGDVKQVVGKLVNDPNLEADGAVEKVQGKVQEKVGQIKKVIGK